MADTTKLDALIAAVEAGVLPLPSVYRVTTRQDQLIEHAFLGSLDAALALHEALLPGWEWDIGKSGKMFDAVVFYPSPFSYCAEVAHGENHARAWLLAILKAHRAKVAG